MRENIPDISSISTCVAPSCSVIFALSVSGVTPELACTSAASESVRALILWFVNAQNSVCSQEDVVCDSEIFCYQILKIVLSRICYPPILCDHQATEKRHTVILERAQQTPTVGMISSRQLECLLRHSDIPLG
jgi:hypothetical protein